MMAKAFAPAKINLTLHITGQRADGYHLLDSLVAFADLGDSLEFSPGPKLSVNVTGEFAAGVPVDERNLVWQAAQAANWTGNINLYKALPHGGGVGGGSSDAAATLRTLAPDSPRHVALSLGADVPVCMLARATRMQGIGDRTEPIVLPDLPAVLVNPGVAVKTGPVFNSLTAKNNPEMPFVLPEFSSPESCAAWLSTQRNDLETPALAIAPQIATVLDALRATTQSLLARMSGSGSTCFALYPSMKAALLAAHEIGAAHPGWWCRAARLS
ncbi:4-(cytidine 5'-diphospho)-2-C-methyl-D-erythritol kinase [Ruegeria arenilitoris]|uniref:4-(cytidine 5'-diphospho)-2-C-methyl-D-erythritol kinase n=1 Tax=Ruegeria arenilitoris TaxID=1173585 RepID=UPI00147B3607|nr:4-(cytidine 5'-diphospho)-2-C-methyl-D-erythritol kinase [Ruegeria arenilitoris]